MWLRFAGPLLLVLILLVGGVLRFVGINWDQFQHVHPDERFIVWVADTVSLPADLADVFDPERSPLNPFRWPQGAGELAGTPRNYAYGHLPLYLLVGAANLAAGFANWLGETTLALPSWLQPVHAVGRHLAEYAYLPLVGRALSALADLGTLVLTYVLARLAFAGLDSASRGHQEGAGASGASKTGFGVDIRALLAAGAYAIAVLPVQLSHFAAVDSVLTFFVVAAVTLSAAWARGAGIATLIAAGAVAGLAVGSKFSAVLLVVPLLVAALHRLPASGRQLRLLALAGRMVGVLAAGSFMFALTNPFAIIEFRDYLGQIMAQNAMVSGAMDAPYTRQYLGTLPYLYFVQQLSQWGLGWPLGTTAWLGLAWAIAQLALRRAAPALTVMLAWALPYFVATGAFHTKFLRYMAPLIPFLLVMAAGAAAWGLRWLSHRCGPRGRFTWLALAVLTGAFTLAWALAFS